MMNLEQKIEAVLFWKGEPIKVKKLAEVLKVSAEETENALANLAQSLESRGIGLLRNDDEITLGTKSELSPLIEELQKEELNKSLSKAALETLSIILYKNGSHRAYIDYVRGVNSSFTLRALSVRGLIEKVPDPKDSRRYIYKPTFELLAYMGVQDVRDLPAYEETLQKLDASYQAADEEAATEANTDQENA